MSTISATKVPVPTPGEVFGRRWNLPRRDDRDGRDDLCGTAPGIKKAVTVVTAVTGSGGESQGGIPAGGDCRKAIQPEPLDFRPTENTCRVGGKAAGLSSLPHGE